MTAPFADGIVPSNLERRSALLVIVGAVLAFLLALAIAPAVNPTFDDAKYVGIGRNVLDGVGPVNVFGSIFLKHSPVWPVLIVLPERIAGIHPIAVGHLVNMLSGAVVLILVGALGWRVRPALGALGAVTLLGQPYYFDIGRTAGIDLPSIALTFGYVLLGFVALRRRSLVLAAVAGLIFGVGFLIKETILPFAPVPFVAAVLWEVAWPSIFRLAAATLAVAALTMSWWFAMHAAYTGEVYRVAYPAWTLVPATIAIAIFVVLGLASESIARRLRGRGWDSRLATRLPDGVWRHRRSIIGWLVAVGWVLLLVWVFDRTPKLLGAGLFNPDQLRAYLTGTFVAVSPIFAFGLGTVVAFVALVRDPRTMSRAARDLLVTVVCGVPLVVLVVGVGEAPRHYIAEMALLGLTGWLGWIAGLHRIVTERDRLMLVLVVLLGLVAVAVSGAAFLRHVGRLWLIVGAAALVLAAIVGVAGAIWLARRGRLWSVGPAIVLAALLLLAGATTVGRAARLPGTLDAVEMATAARVNAWIRENVPAGSVVAVGPYLSMETAMDLPSGYRAIQIRHFLTIGDPAAPLGLRSEGLVDGDWIAIDVAPYKANQFNVFEARQVTRLVEQNRPVVYVYNLTRKRSSLSILGVLTPENGFTEVASWSYPLLSDTIETHVFEIDHERFAIDRNRMFISPEALDRLAVMLEREPEEGRLTAANLLGRIVRPADGSLDVGLARLEALVRSGS